MASRSRVFTQFGEPQDMTPGSTTLRVQCNHCSATVTASTKATSNLLVHLKRHHPNIHKAIQNPEPVSQPAMSQFITTTPTTPQKWKHTDPRQQIVSDLLVQFIMSNLLPLSIVESEEFHKFTEKLNPSYVIPSRNQRESQRHNH